MPQVIYGLADYLLLTTSLEVQRHILTIWVNDLLTNAIHIVRYMCMYIEEYIEKILHKCNWSVKWLHAQMNNAGKLEGPSKPD